MLEILKSNITFSTNDIQVIIIIIIVKLSGFHMTSGSFSLSN